MLARTLLRGTAVSSPTELFSNGRFVIGRGDVFESINPYTGKSLCTINGASVEDIDDTVTAARAALKGWSASAPERTRLMNRLADLIERDQDRLAMIESLDSGKSVRLAREFDLADTVACLRYYAGWAGKAAGETEMSVDKICYTIKEPLGVIAQIIPWNYPLLMLAWKLGPALASGCTVIVKPAENTSLSALAVCELSVEAGFPPGVLNVLPGLGATTGAALASHMHVDKIAFTGSAVTGRKIMTAAAMSNFKPVTLELGGKSPAVIFESADLQEAANWLSLGIFFNSGQDCCASSRIFVADKIFDQFLALLVVNAKACVIGDPLEEATSFGPLISAVQSEKVSAYIAMAIKQGATVAYGGQTRGNLVEPTILINVKDSDTCALEEIFGPVVVVSRFNTEEEVIQRANATTYGLAAAVFSKDASQTMRLTQALEAGTVWVNQYGILHPSVPFGGYKMSGIGRELGKAGLDAYLTTKAVHHNISQTLAWPL